MTAYTKMGNLGIDNPEILKSMEMNKIEYRKQLGKLISKSKSDAKGEKCYYCGEICSSFCNSHSIPATFLRNIAVDGKVYSNNSLINLPLLDKEKGVNHSGTFNIICRDCDSKIFSDYEDPDKYENPPTSKMVTQIALKDFLKSISKRQSELALYNNMSDLGLPEDFLEQKQSINNLDLQEYISDFNRAKKILEKNIEGEYRLIFHQKLDYIVPMAFQSNIAIIVDFEGAIINNIYNHSFDYKIKGIHLCVFPLKDSSVVMMFVDSKNKRYRKFIKQFIKLSLNDKLAAINFMIFSYSEDLFLNKNIKEEIINNENLVAATQQTTDIISSNSDADTNAIARESFNFSKMHEMPNLLLEEYKIH